AAGLDRRAALAERDDERRVLVPRADVSDAGGAGAAGQLERGLRIVDGSREVVPERGVAQRFEQHQDPVVVPELVPGLEGSADRARDYLDEDRSRKVARLTAMP